MKKSILERFISKYNLAASAESVTWTANKSGLSTKFISEDKHVIGDVKCSGIDMDAGEYSIYETGILRSLLSVAGDEIDMSVQKTNGKATALIFKDSSSKVSFVLADPTNIPKVPDIKALPNFGNVIVLDSTFMERFVRAKGALTDIETFTILSDGTNIEVILGYSDMNTNRVNIKTTVQTAEKIDPLDFHARYMKEILVANKEAKSGKLEIAKEGLARITFELDEFTVTYYLPQIQREN
jgi:hypothetical protein